MNKKAIIIGGNRREFLAEVTDARENHRKQYEYFVTTRYMPLGYWVDARRVKFIKKEKSND